MGKRIRLPVRVLHGAYDMRRSDGFVRKNRQAHNHPGFAHELTFSCFHRLPLLSKDRTREWFIEALDTARGKHCFAIWSYVIMPEHAHVLIHPRKDTYDISSILKSIKQPVARRATDFLRHTNPTWLKKLKVTWPSGRVEYRFWQQGGGYDRDVVTNSVNLAAIEYIHNNPVRRGLTDSAIDWPWSSARAYAGEPSKLAIDLWTG